MAASEQIYLAGEIALWLQMKCGDPWEFLGCHNLTGVSVPRGDTNPLYCRVGKNRYEIQRTFKGAAGLGTATVVTYDTVLNYLQELPCAFNLAALHSSSGSDDDPTNYDYFYYYNGVEVTSEDTDTHVAGMTPEEQTSVMLSMPMSFQERVKVKDLDDQSVSVASVLPDSNDLTAITYCDDPSCDNFGNLSTLGCQKLFISMEGTTPKVLKSVDGGSNWTQLASPFTTASDPLNDIECNDDVVIVTNGTTPSYAYSWDAGVTWTEITSVTKVINKIFMMGGTKIWFVCQDGYIYYSANRGASVTLQNAGAATTQSLNDIDAASSLLLYAVGDNNAFIRTEDGGTIWSAVTGPAAAIFPNDLYRVLAIPGTDIVFVGDEQGNVYRSADKGDTWATVLASNSNIAGGIYGLAACDCNVIMVAGNDTDPYFYPSPTGYVYQSVDGGNTWQGIDLPSNSGIRDLFCCDVNTYWAVGDAGFVVKLAGPSVTD
jgi:photosystem II stability/assembly factor-like uncharacterized protein